jgi:hypothetical protein
LLLSALVLLCCTTISADVPRAPVTPPAVELNNSSRAEPAAEAEHPQPDAPAPKWMASRRSEVELGRGAGAGSSSIEPGLKIPVKPAVTESYETPRQRKIWYGLMAASHGAAAFDAWTTRRAISGGYGVEGDPLQRPFANSGAIYVTTQVTPLLMDYLGRRMMRSSHPWMRRVWWVPQAASASVSFGAGIHNYGVVH